MSPNSNNHERDQDMAKMARDDDGLSPQESRAAALLAQGLTQAGAYRQAFDVKRMKPETVWNKASKLFSRSEVQARVCELLKAARVQDIESVGEAFATMLGDMESARADGNHNAVAQYTRIKMQAHGALKDNVSMTIEQRATDEQLIKAVAGDDPVLEAALWKQLGAPDHFDDETRH